MFFVFAEEASPFFHTIGTFFWGQSIHLDTVYIYGIVLAIILPLLIMFFEVFFLLVAFLEALAKDCVKIKPGVLLFPSTSNPLIQGFRLQMDLFPDCFMEFLVKFLSGLLYSGSVITCPLCFLYQIFKVAYIFVDF